MLFEKLYFDAHMNFESNNAQFNGQNNPSLISFFRKKINRISDKKETNKIKLTDKFDDKFSKELIKTSKLDYVVLFQKLRSAVGHKFYRSKAPKLTPELSGRL